MAATTQVQLLVRSVLLTHGDLTAVQAKLQLRVLRLYAAFLGQLDHASTHERTHRAPITSRRHCVRAWAQASKKASKQESKQGRLP